MVLQNNEVYVLHNVKTRTVVDLDFQHDGITVRGWENNGHKNQKWRAIDRGDGLWDFQNLTDGHFLSVWGNNLFDGAGVVATDVSETVWRIVPDTEKAFGDDVYHLVATHSDLSLDLDDQSADNGTQVVVRTISTGMNQLWKFKKAEA